MQAAMAALFGQFRHRFLMKADVPADPGEDDPETLDAELQLLLQVVETVEQKIEADRRKEVGLHGNEKPVARVERVLRGGLQIGRAVANDDVVLFQHLLQLAGKDALAAGTGREVKIEKGQLEVTRDQVETGNIRKNVLDDASLKFAAIVGRLLVAAVNLEDVGHRAVLVGPFRPGLFRHDAERSIRLRVEIDEQYALAVVPGQVGGEIDGDGRLADAALHVEE